VGDISHHKVKKFAQELSGDGEKLFLPTTYFGVRVLGIVRQRAPRSLINNEERKEQHTQHTSCQWPVIDF